MFRTICIFEPAGVDAADLRDAFGVAIPTAALQRFSSPARLVAACESSDGQLLAVVPTRSSRRGGGLSLISQLRSRWPVLPIVAVADEGNVDAAAEAITAGANDFLVRGARLEERITTLLGKLRGLIAAIDRGRQLDEYNTELREAIHARYQIIGQSPVMRLLIQQIDRVAKVPRPALILGERGTGKELVARAIHEAAGAASRPMVTVNCAAFGDALLESELFGHEKGAFTGADQLRRGKFELADGGTLFLDEISHMSAAFQQKILRVVEYGQFTRVGGSTELRTTARVLAATNVDLQQKIKRGEFLPDLHDRLAFDVVDVPPLRARGADIELLARHFLEQFARETLAFRPRTLSQEAIEALRGYSFPGNIRELKNIIERAACRDSAPEIRADELGLDAADSLVGVSGTFEEKVTRFQQRLLQEAMTQAEGNQAQAARLLGLSYHQFRYYHGKLLRRERPD